jgi:acyl-CoA synthetase (AMP-forming)/AMP-acid ligase II
MAYSELDRRARATAVAMRRSIAPGERALLVFPTGADFLVSLFACAYAGVVAIPVPFPGEGAASGAARLAGIVRDATPSVVLSTPEVTDQPDKYELSANRLLAVARVPADLADEFQDPGHDAEAIAFLQYTSGSTREPKGVQVSHHNALANLNDICTGFPLDMADGDRLRIVSWLPLFHDMGLLQVLLPILSGGLIVLFSPMTFLLRPVLWLEAITRYRAHMASSPNFGYDLCARRVTQEQRRGLDLSAWRVALNGSEPVRSHTIDVFARTFAAVGFDPAASMPAYGMAEGTFYVSGALGAAGHLRLSAAALERESVARPADGDEPIRNVVSCGPVAAAVDARIVDPGIHRECAAGRVGEIWVAGENVSRGYWGREDARFGARLADTPGGPFLRTGDLGFRHGDELYVLGRLDDVIVLDGRNHYPQDIELVAEQSHDALAPGRVAAFGYECDDETAVAVVAETALRVRIVAPGMAAEPGQFDGAEVIRAVRAAVSAEHQIRVAQVVLLRPGGLPRTTSGKVRRRRCRELFLSGGLKTWFSPVSPDDADRASAPPAR